MKVGRFIIDILKIKCERDDKKRYKNVILDEKYHPILNVQYKGNDPHHCFDIIHAPKDVEHKKCCIIDIHGGAYIFGKRSNNHGFGAYFADQGFDFIALDYIPNNGKRSVGDLLEDCLDALYYIQDHLKELNLEYKYFAITGDSAGGHLALILSELITDPKYLNKINKKPLNIPLICTLVNCTVFDYVHIGEGVLTPSGLKRMIGTDANDIVKRTLYDPGSHIGSLKYPLFISTCKNDFIRNESLKLVKMLEDRDIKYKFIDLDEEDKNVGHVHNVIYPHLDQSIYINNEMINFIFEVLATQK